MYNTSESGEYNISWKSSQILYSPGAIVHDNLCKNRAPHVNFCHPVVLKSYGSNVSKKIGWHFFKPGSRSFQGHIISNV